MAARPVFRHHEVGFCTQYRELSERALTAGTLLPGTSGTLHRRTGTGYAYWYRIFYPVPGTQAETLVGRVDDTSAETAMRQRMAFAEWTSRQVASLRKLGFQVADKHVARIVVELHNLGAFAAGLLVLGSLGHMAWLNELGVTGRASRKPTSRLPGQPILELGAARAFLDSPLANKLPFGGDDATSATTIRLSGMLGVLIELGVPADGITTTLPIPDCTWAAHTKPHYDYLLDAPESGAVLAGGHCIPVLLPQAARLVWHTLFVSTRPDRSPEQAAADQQQALILAAALIEHDPWALLTAWEKAPSTMAKAIHPLREALLSEVVAHPELRELIGDCLRAS